MPDIMNKQPTPENSPRCSDSSESFQNMLEEVESLIRDMSQNHLNLDKLVEQVERGYTLIQSMRQKLDQTKMRIEVLQSDFEKETPVGPEKT